MKKIYSKPMMTTTCVAIVRPVSASQLEVNSQTTTSNQSNWLGKERDDDYSESTGWSDGLW